MKPTEPSLQSQRRRGVGTISGIIIGLVYTILITVGAYQLRKAYVTRNQSLAILDINQRSHEALANILNDLRKGLVFLGACPLSSVIRTAPLTQEERGYEITLLTSENNRVSVVAPESRNLGSNLLVWSGKDFIAGDEVTICNGNNLLSGKIINVGLPANNVNLAQLRFTQDWTSLNWQLPVVVAKTKTIRYWVAERNGKEVLYRKENNGNDVVLAQGIHELTFEYQEKNGSNTTSLQTDANVVGFRIGVRTMPLRPELAKFLDDEDRHGVRLAFNMPYLNIFPLPHPLKLTVEHGSDADGVDSLVLSAK